MTDWTREEDEEFNRMERKTPMRKDDDDDIQDYVNAKDRAFERTFHQVVRNQTLEEVAREFDKMPALGDTAASFACFVRNMKK